MVDPVAAILIGLLSSCAILFWIRMLEDCLTRQEKRSKLLWCVLFTGGHVLAAMAYFFSVYRPSHRAALGRH